MLLKDLMNVLQCEYVYLYHDMQYFDEGTVSDLCDTYCFGDALVTKIDIDDCGNAYIYY